MSAVFNKIRSPWNQFRSIMSNSKIHIKTNSAITKSLATASVANKDDKNSTIDTADVDFFSKKMHDWWDPNGPVKPLHSMNLLRVPFVRDGLVDNVTEERTLNPLKDKKILDVGCGGGILSEGLARLGAEVTGIDASEDLIQLANAHKVQDPKIKDNQPTYIYTTVEEHSDKFANYYDGVVASEVIEHVNNKELFIKSCVRAVKPGGKIFFTTPNRTPLSNVFTIYIAEYILGAIPRGTHQYEKFITPTELTFLLERNDCHVEMTFGMMYHVLSNKWEFIRSQQLMYALQCVKL